MTDSLIMHTLEFIRVSGDTIHVKEVVIGTLIVNSAANQILNFDLWFTESMLENIEMIKSLPITL